VSIKTLKTPKGGSRRISKQMSYVRIGNETFRKLQKRGGSEQRLFDTLSL
jgi:hypothetical protein